MSKTIDERVVEMTFDNKDFEKNVEQSMSTIDKLKAKLNFKGAAKGLDAVNNSAKNVNFNNMSNALDSVRLKFNALQVAGVTALANITNSMVNTGRNMLNSFTIQPITDGFREYETQLNSVQTIMANTASKGTTIDQVTDALNELNTYADKTIYNFTEMTRNIGTFTAAGVDLDTSVNAIQGIANLAAMSGSSSVQAATAMYQLSQALAAGKVSLMDWNSVVNAGMGGEQFQNALIRTSKILGTGAEQAIEKYGTFRESLTQGQWLTTQVLTETLKQISGAYSEAELIQQGYSEQQAKDIVMMAQTAEDAATKVRTFTQMLDTLKEAVGSGWAQTWQIVFGDFYEARDFWTGISDMLGDMVSASSEARNTVLKDAFSGSWEQIQASIKNTGASIDDFYAKIKEVYNETGNNYDDLISKAGSLDEAIKDGAIGANTVREAFRRFSDAAGDVNGQLPEIESKFSSFRDVVKDIWKYGFNEDPKNFEALSRAGYDYAEVSDLITKITNDQEIAVSDLTDEQLRAIGVTEEELTSLGDLRTQLDDTNSTFSALFDTLMKESGRVLLLDSVRNILDAIIKPMTAFKNAWHDIFAVDASTIYGILEAFNHFTESLIISNETSDKLTRTFRGLFSIFSIFTNFAGGAFSAVFKVIQGVLDNFDIGILDVTAGIGDALTAFAEFVNENNIVNAALSWLADRITDVIKGFSDFANMVREAEIVEKVISRLTDGFNALRGIATDIFSGIQPFVQDFLDLMGEISTMSFDEFMDRLKEIGSGVMEFLGDKINKMVETVGTTFTNIFNDISETFGFAIPIVNNVKDAIVDFVSTVFNRVKEIGPGGIVALIFGISAIATFKTITGLIEKLTSPIESLSDAIGGVGKSISKWADAKSFRTKAEGVRILAESVAILAGAVVLIATLDPSQLQNATYAIMGIAIAVGGLYALVSHSGADKPGDKKGINGFVLNVAAMAASILAVASAIKIMESVNPDYLIPIIGSLIITVGALAAIGIAMDKFGGKGKAEDFGGPALQIVALAAALRVVADAFVAINDINPNNLLPTIFGLIACVGALGILALAMDRLKVGKGGASLLAMVIGLRLFIASIGAIADADTGAILAALPNFILIFGMIAALMFASSLAGANSLAGSAGLILMSLSLGILTQVIGTLANMDPAAMKRGTDAVSQLMGFMAVFVAMTHFAGTNALKGGGALLAMSVSMLILAGVIAIIGMLDPADVAVGVAAIGVLTLFFDGLLVASHFASDSTKTIVAMVAVVGILAAAVAVMTLLDPAALTNAVLCLDSLMFCFSLMMAASKLATGAYGAMFAMVGVVALLAGILSALAILDIQTSIQNAAALGILMVSLSAALAIGSLAKNPSSELGIAMAMLLPALAGVAAVVAYIAGIPAQANLANVAAIGILLGELAGITTLFGKVAVDPAMAAKGAAALDAVTVIIGGMIAIVGAINEFMGNGLATAVQSAIPVFQGVGQAIGELIGGLVGGIVSGAGQAMMSMLPALGQALTSFWLSIQPFVMGTKMMGDDALGGIKTLVEALMMITAADFVENLNSFFQGGGSSMDSFGQNLTKLATALVDFSDTLSDGNFNGEVATQAAYAGKALAEMQNAMQGEGGIFQMFTGVKDMGKFGEQLVDFGEAICEFSNTIVENGGIDQGAVQAAADAGKIMTELQNGLVANGESGSVIEFLLGQKNLSTFGEQLVDYGEAICEFSDTVSGEGKINKDAVQAAADAGQIMSELEKSIDTTDGGLIGFLAGQTNLADFGTQLVDYGQALVDFSNVIAGEDSTGINSEAIQELAGSSESLVNLANSLPEDSIWDSKLSLTEFGSKLIQFGRQIVTMSNVVKDLDTTKITEATNVADTMANVLVSLQGVDESVINKFWVLDSLSDTLTTFSENLADVDLERVNTAVVAANRIKAFILGISGITSDSASGFVASVQSLASISFSEISSAFDSVDFSLIGVNIMTRLSMGIQTGNQNVIAQLRIALSEATEASRAFGSDYSSVGLYLITELAKGIQNGAQNVQAQVSIMIQNAADALNGYEGYFYAAGSNLAVGFANGINASAYRARVAASAMANAAKTAAEAALDEHSPSREMYKVGAFAGQGFIDGIASYIEKSSSVGASMAQAALNATAQAAEMFGTFGDLDSQIAGLRELSEALDTSKKDEEEANAETEESTENTSKLSTALSSVADSLQEVTDRRNDLSALNKLLQDTSLTLSDGFIAELMSADGQYAGAISEMVNLTKEQIQELNDVFVKTESVENMNTMFETISESITTLNKQRKNMSAINRLLKRTGVTFSKSFIKEIVSSGGQYADVLASMVDLTDDQLQSLINSFNETKALEETQERMESLVEILSDEDGLAASFEAAGINFEEFAKRVVDAGDDISDIQSQIEDFAQTVSDGFSKMEIKDQTGVAEFTDNLENNMIIAQEWAGNLQTVFAKISSVSPQLAEQFQKAVLEGGIDQYGRIIAEMSTMDTSAIMDVVNKWSQAGNLGTQLGTQIQGTLYGFIPAMAEAGSDITQGVANGIDSGLGEVNDSIMLMCTNIEETTKSYFGIHSPSTLMYKIGEYMVQGLVNGVVASSTALNEAFTLVNQAIDFLKQLGEKGIDIQVRVTPVIDMADFNAKLEALKSSAASSVSSDIMNAVDNINNSMSQNGAGTAEKQLTAAVNKLTDKVDSINPDNFGVTYQQNNYSPKALSTATIYRRTKNQISLARNKNGKSFNQ